jgi:ABC-type antimicrobial peptide transport system permease subunit
MVAHHVLTLMLFSVSHIFNTQRMGLLILAIFNFSNPFMHTAKVLHYVKAMKSFEVVAFGLFACSFAISRCAGFPLLLRSIFHTVLERVRTGDHRVVVPAFFCLIGLAALQLLQFYWLARIVRCARKPLLK